jgi:hypothetical protein
MRNRFGGGPSRREVAAAGMAFALAPVLSEAEPVHVTPPKAPGAEGFDFLLGSWSVRHRRLRDRLAGSTDWLEFPGSLVVRPLLDGLGNVDENVLNMPAEQVLATSLRVFNPKTFEWSIYWIDARSPGLDPPVVGRFAGREGRFYNDDTFMGRPIRVRFIYRNLGPRSADWSQAFSADGGASWETNWTMQFERTAEL